MTRKERRWCWIFSGALALLTTLPYIVGFAAQGASWRFSGFVVGVEDGNSYIAKMMLGASGSWLFRSPYSTLPQRGALAFLPYLLLGKLAAGPALPEQLIGLFHLFRIAVTPWGVFATYRFTSVWIRDMGLRRGATLVACCGGGLGWSALFLGQPVLPLEFYSPEAFGFLAFLGIPHLILARALLLDSLASHVRGLEGHPVGWRAAIGLAVAGLIQPILLVTAFVVIGLHGALRRWVDRIDLRVWIRRTLRDVLPAGILAGGYAVMVATDPYLEIWARQNRLPSPPIGAYLLSYGPAIVVVIWLLRRATVRKSFRAWLPLAWVLAFPILAYAPVSVQRRLIEGTWVALLVLVASAWAGSRPARTGTRSAPLAFGALSLPAAALLLVLGLNTARSLAEPVFYPAGEDHAAAWLRQNAAPGEVVLSSYAVGNRLPSRAPVRVVVGHGPETANLDRLLPQIAEFYSDSTDAERRVFLAEQHVAYVLWGPAERALGDWNPGTMPNWDLLYSGEGYEIFRVR
ncbi:MAG: hypothetical protein WD906_04315 [Anaerolineales bacterium]